jgi:hypothetical protein
LIAKEQRTTIIATANFLMLNNLFSGLKSMDIEDPQITNKQL